MKTTRYRSVKEQTGNVHFNMNWPREDEWSILVHVYSLLADKLDKIGGIFNLLQTAYNIYTPKVLCS